MTSRFTGALLYQLSYEATDVGSRSIVGSYVPVKEMSSHVFSRWLRLISGAYMLEVKKAREMDKTFSKRDGS